MGLASTLRNKGKIFGPNCPAQQIVLTLLLIPLGKTIACLIKGK